MGQEEQKEKLLEVEEVRQRIEALKKSVSEMADYMTGDNPACPYMFLWNPIDVGRVAGYTLIEMVNGSLTGALGESFTAADGNTYTVTEAGDGGTEIIIGPPFRFDTENIEEWAQVY